MSVLSLFPGRGQEHRGHALHWTEAFLLTIALLCLGWVGYNWIASEFGQVWSNYALDARLRGTEPGVVDFWQHVVQGKQDAATESTAEQESSKGKEQEGPQWPARLETGEDVGRIEIPRLRISSIVRQGVDDQTLSRAVGHVPYTALPGQHGNVGLAAHRDTYFRNLRDVRYGDVIRVVTSLGTFEYVVDSLQIVTPKNVEVLNPAPDPSLTLVTCYPFNYIGHAPKRFIVRARQKDPAPPASKRS